MSVPLAVTSFWSENGHCLDTSCNRNENDHKGTSSPGANACTAVLKAVQKNALAPLNFERKSAGRPAACGLA